MNKKSFVMQPSEKGEIVKMPKEDLLKFLKGDGHDDKREAIWHKDITETQFESALFGVEATIKKLQKDNTAPVTTFKPWEDRLAVFPDAVEEMTKAGIYKPQQFNQEKPCLGTVVAVGPKVDSTLVKVGMKILYGKYAGTPITASEADPREILILRFDDCFGER